MFHIKISISIFILCWCFPLFAYVLCFGFWNLDIKNSLHILPFFFFRFKHILILCGSLCLQIYYCFFKGMYKFSFIIQVSWFYYLYIFSFLQSSFGYKYIIIFTRHNLLLDKLSRTMFFSILETRCFNLVPIHFLLIAKLSPDTNIAGETNSDSYPSHLFSFCFY